MSVSELARVSGVSKATISGVERGVGNPAIDTVWALAKALNMPFGALFDDDMRDLVELRRIEDAQVVSRRADSSAVVCSRCSAVAMSSSTSWMSLPALDGTPLPTPPA